MKNKHLSLSNRIDIEKYLSYGFNFSEIAKLLDKSTSTISFEVKTRKQRIKKKNPYANSANYICPYLTKPPYVCNPCDSKHGCRKTRYEYFAKDADALYRNTLVNSRTGIDMAPDDFNTLNILIKDGISKGHSFYMILNNHKDDINVSLKTIYNYLHKDYLDITKAHLPRIVRYKQWDKKEEVKSRNLDIRIGRTYNDFLKYKEEFFIENGYDAEVIEMDTVEGVKGADEPYLLTFLFVRSNFLLAFKIKDKTMKSVNEKIDEIKDKLGLELFSKLFHIILTDNGSEFFDPDYIEDNGIYNNTHLFYCDPRHAEQKGAIEVAHEYIRRYIPKSNSFNPYSQHDINLMVNHINSIPRAKQQGLSAFKVQQVIAPIAFFENLNYKEIYSLDIIIKPSLIKSKKNTTTK